ncbi:MAG: DegT/DnrJ/EryC1/StrS aminotransferase family protein [Oscillospiraceae bacterium]|nr:DegT/DnrJ/EryC1/StrS aminotransferase family protein [Oscillospiraceae bacterium]
MNIPFYKPDITEDDIQEVVNTLRSGWITTGGKTAQLERELARFCSTEKAVCLSSQTAAAELTLRLLGIGQGDEVIVPAYTYTATCSVVCHVGATPVLVDCADDSPEMDLDKLEKAITHRTKCIIPVDIAGKMCDYKSILEAVKAKSAWFLPKNELQKAFGRIIIMADAAHSLGAFRSGEKSGQAADFTTFSFHAVKNLTTAEGGAVTWRKNPALDSEKIYRQYKLFSLHGQDKDALEKSRSNCWEYDVTAPYYKCNMTDMQAALGVSQLRRYEATLEKRRSMIENFNKAFKSLPVQLIKHKGRGQMSSGHLYMTKLSNGSRDKVIAALAEDGIRCNVHYKPLPLLTAYKKMGFAAEDYPIAVQHYNSELTLPLYSTMTLEEQEYLVEKFKKCF